MLRLAHQNDLSQLAELCLQCRNAYPTPVETNIEQITETLQSWMLSPKSEKIIIVSEQKNSVVGLIMAFTAPLLFSDFRQAYELVWWVDPAYHRTRDAFRLFDAYEFWAYTSGCHSVQTSYVHGHGWSDLSKFYEKRGYVRTETSYKKVLNGS